MLSRIGGKHCEGRQDREGKTLLASSPLQFSVLFLVGWIFPDLLMKKYYNILSGSRAVFCRYEAKGGAQKKRN